MKPSSPTASGSRQPDLEALRAVAAAMVVACHLPWYQYFPDGVWPAAPLWLSPKAPLLGIGGFAVVLFLVLSGVGMCRLLVLKAPPYLVFVKARLSRLFSVYWAAAAVGLLIAVGLGTLRWSDSGNVVLALLGLGFVSPDSWAAVWPSWWYIAIAWQVVVAMPLLVLGMRRLRPAGTLAVTALVVLASCFVVPAVGLDYAEKALVFARALEVLGGAFLALELWPEVRRRLGVSRSGAFTLVLATIACLATLLVAGLGGRWLYRAAGLALVAAVVYGRPLERLSAVRAATWAGWAGGLSFAVYVLHEPVLLLARRLTGAPTRISMALLAAVSVPAVILASVLFQRVFDSLSARIASRRRSRTREVA